MKRRQRKALSYILSVVIMTLITTSMAGVVLLWGLNEIGTSRDSFSSSIRSRMERVQERLVVEDVYFIDATHLQVYVRNTGAIRIVIDRVYVNHQAGNITSKLSLGVQESGSLIVDVADLDVDPLSIGETYTINVATTRGSTVSGQWKN